MKNLFPYIFPAITLLAVLSLAACRDEEFGGVATEGEPAVISLNVKTTPADVLTRADNEDLVQSLWVAIYNANTGKRSYAGLSTTDTNGKPFSGYLEEGSVSLTITTKSGPSYIVAVANPQTNYGYTITNAGETPAKINLLTLLDNADTWQDFLSIAISSQPDGQNVAFVEQPSHEAGMPMAGIYVESAATSTSLSSAHPSSWAEIEPVNIKPGADNLSGAIHLRRPYSHINFEVRASGSVVDVETLSYEVVNVPEYSWLLEQRKDRTTENPGDILDPSPLGNPHFRTSSSFSSTYISTETDASGKVQKFDWWQLDNKRTGLKDVDSYGERELQWGEGQQNPLTNKGIKQNYNPSGLYASLCGSYDTGNNPDNNATFVRIRMKVSYMNQTTAGDNSAQPANGNDNIVNGDIPGGTPIGGTGNNALPEGAVRIAFMTYTVHLGYIGKNPDPRDFNTFRNSIYTYRMTVSGLTDVLIEAFRKGDRQPGAEGVVTDTTYTPIELDCHFSTFNIYLSDDELKAFSYSMTTYENGISDTFYELWRDGKWDICRNLDHNGDGVIDDNSYYNNPHYTWVRIAKLNSDPETKEPVTMADYTTALKGQGRGWRTPEGIMLPSDIRGYATEGRLSAGWFTVFISEYSYCEENQGIPTEKASERERWKGYVNQPERVVYFYVNEERSYDNATQYFRSKYMATQRSIQTYYNVNGTSKSALGVEHANENLGMNLRWTWSTLTNSTTNGRYTVWQYINSKSKNWDDFIDKGKIQIVNAFSNQGLNQPETYRNLPMINLIDKNSLEVYRGYENSYKSRANTFDPQTNHSTAQYVEIINACMNRNRDENGNGTIDREELKWFVPSTNTYIRVIIGRNALEDPIMDYPDKLEKPAGTGGNPYSRYRYATSNASVLWADEGISTSNLGQYTPSPWQIRCVRELGTDLSNISAISNVTNAFSIDKENNDAGGGVVKVANYSNLCLRGATTGTLPAHFTNSPENRIAIYGFEWAPFENDKFLNISADYESLNSLKIALSNNNIPTWETYKSWGNWYYSKTDYNLCYGMETLTGRKGWRTPNQKELALIYMTNQNYTFSNGYGYTYILSCTLAPYDSSGELGTDLIQKFSTMRAYNNQRSNQAMCITDYNVKDMMLRCVRDLTAEEADMPYNQIKNRQD